MMTRQKQKKVFLWSTGIFFVFILYISYDIGSRTTFPGTEKKHKAPLSGQLTVEEHGLPDDETPPESIIVIDETYPSIDSVETIDKKDDK